MDNWKIPVLVLTICTLVLTDLSLSRLVEDSPELFQAWDESQRSLPMAAAWKRSRVNRFYGLMGKRWGTRMSLKVNRRKKGESFLGLMGRSAHPEYEPGDFPSAPTADVSQKPQEEWLMLGH